MAMNGQTCPLICEAKSLKTWVKVSFHEENYQIKAGLLY